MKQNNRFWSALVLYGMLALSLLLVALMGAKMYQNATETQQNNDNMRATLAYVQSRIAAADSAGGITVVQGPEGSALILHTADAKFEERIYCFEGSLLEETSICGEAFAPDTAQTIAACNAFDAVLAKDNLLRVSANGRTAYASLHCGEATPA